jgi:prolipoprotein diacylglyceryltransferase
MDLLFVILLICLLVYLFTVHLLAKEDLVFVRKNITLETLFNLAFYTCGIGLLASRAVFVALHFKPGYLHPLVFLLFPYFPGLSLIGGIIGAMLFLVLYGRRKKIPAGRIFDFFAIALLAALPFGFFGAQLLTGMKDLFAGVLMPIVFLATLFFFSKILLPLNIRGEIRDGSLGYLFLLIYSFTALLANIVHAHNDWTFLAQLENILLLCVFVFALLMLVFQERARGLVRK